MPDLPYGDSELTDRRMALTREWDSLVGRVRQLDGFEDFLRPPRLQSLLPAEADGPVDRKRPTQVGRALAHLGVEHIAAYSPQARGRSERMFQTLQDRLVKELALAGITTVDAANAFIRDVYLPAHNARFAVKAEQVGFRVRRDHWRRSE